MYKLISRVASGTSYSRIIGISHKEQNSIPVDVAWLYVHGYHMSKSTAKAFSESVGVQMTRGRRLVDDCRDGYDFLYSL